MHAVGPWSAIRLAAKLLEFGRIDAPQADGLAVDLQRVAVDDGGATDGLRAPGGGDQHGGEYHQGGSVEGAHCLSLYQLAAISLIEQRIDYSAD